MAFYEDLGDGRFASTVHTTGPWDPGFQHGGPPSALLGRAVERHAPRDDMMVALMTVEILGAIPVADLAVTARLVRPGRSVELLQSELSHDGREVARASAWRLRRVAGWVSGYLQAIEWRFTDGHFVDPGPAVGWGRMREPLLAGEDPSPLTRVLVLADSSNGVSSALDIRQWKFINPELTVHLHREAVGEWVCLDALTVVSPGGVGLATSYLSDQLGPLGVDAQSLLVGPRS